MTVLILSTLEDPHAAAVAGHLEQLSVRTKVWSFNEFIASTSVTYGIADQSGEKFLRINNDELLHLNDVEAIWFRRPGFVKSPRMPERWIEDMIESESRNALNGILRSLNCLMVNHPGNDAESLLKLTQLNAAQSIGLSVPATIITNEPESALEFCQKHNGRVIYKLIGENTNFHFPNFEFPTGIPTMPMTGDDLEFLKQVRFSPHLFQQRVDKQYDVRATVVGEKIFAARIDSQSGKSKLDWRMDYSVPMTKMQLPDDVSEKCLAMMRKFGLNYAAFDFCANEEDQLFFLEFNCAGQYMWLEHRTDMQISKEIALLLAKKSKALVL